MLTKLLKGDLTDENHLEVCGCYNCSRTLDVTSGICLGGFQASNLFFFSRYHQVRSPQSFSRLLPPISSENVHKCTYLCLEAEDGDGDAHDSSDHQSEKHSFRAIITKATENHTIYTEESSGTFILCQIHCHVFTWIWFQSCRTEPESMKTKMKFL